MSDIPPIQSSQAPLARIGPNSRPNDAPAAPGRTGAADEVQFSPVARLLGQLHNLPSVRNELITTARERIDAGFYDSEQVTDQTVEALAAEEFALA